MRRYSTAPALTTPPPPPPAPARSRLTTTPHVRTYRRTYRTSAAKGPHVRSC